MPYSVLNGPFWMQGEPGNLSALNMYKTPTVQGSGLVHLDTSTLNIDISDVYYDLNEYDVPQLLPSKSNAILHRPSKSALFLNSLYIHLLYATALYHRNTNQCLHIDEVTDTHTKKLSLVLFEVQASLLLLQTPTSIRQVQHSFFDYSILSRQFGPPTLPTNLQEADSYLAAGTCHDTPGLSLSVGKKAGIFSSKYSYPTGKQ